MRKMKLWLKILFLLFLIISFILMVTLPLTIGVTWDVKYRASGNGYNVYYNTLTCKYRPFWYLHKNAFDGKIIYDSVLLPLYVLSTLFCGLSVLTTAGWMFVNKTSFKNELFMIVVLFILISFIFFNTFAGFIPKRTNGENNYWTENDYYRLRESVSDEIEKICQKELDGTADMLSHPRWDTIKIFDVTITKSNISMITVFIPDFFMSVLIIGSMWIIIYKLMKGKQNEKITKFNFGYRSNSRTY